MSIPAAFTMFTRPPPLRASVWEWVQAVLLAVNLGWTTLCLGGYRADTLAVTVALNAAMLAVHFGARGLAAQSTRRWHPAGWLLVPFLVYAAANVLWVTPVRWLGWHDWMGWAQMIAVFWVVVNDARAPAIRRLLFGVLIALATVGVALACYQRFVNPAWGMLGDPRMAQFLGRPSGAFAVPNSFAGFLILLFPAVTLPLWKRGASAVERVFAGYLAGVLLLGLGLTVSRGAWLGLLVALALWPLLAVRRRRSKRVAVSAAVAVLGLVALGAVYANVPSARERLDVLWRDRGEVSRPGMWRAAWLTFRENPWWGSGAGSYEVMFEKYRPENEQKHPQWAHNEYLNTLSDYGAAGFGLFFGACGVLVWRVGRRRGAKQPLESRAHESWVESADFSTAAAVGLVAFGLHLAVDFHLKIPALAMSAATMAGLALGRVEWTRALANGVSGQYQMLKMGRFFALAVASSVVLASALWVMPRYHAEGVRRAARLRIDGLAGGKSTAAERAVVLRAAEAELTRALSIDAANPQAWADRAYAVSALGHDDVALVKAHGQAVENDARRALALSTALPEFWIRLGVGLDMQGRWGGAGDAFSEALMRAPMSATTWFYHAYHFALNPVTLPLARSAVATSLRLDPYHPEADSLRRNLADRR